MLDHQTKGHEHESVVISFLTVLSCRSDGLWESYENFTPYLSALIAIFRLIIIYLAWIENEEEDNYLSTQELPASEYYKNLYGLHNLISNKVIKFIINKGKGNAFTPIQFILRLRNYGLAAQRNTASEGYINWVGDTLLYKGNRLSLPTLHYIIQSALDKACQTLYQDLLMQEDYSLEDRILTILPQIPWDTAQDNIADSTLGYSFLQSLFEEKEGSKSWLLSTVIQLPLRKRQWFLETPGQGFQIRPQQASSYSSFLDKFLEVLALLIHLSSGLPARGNELLTLRHRNTSAGGTRNIFLDQGMVMLVAGIHKGFSRTERLKVIHRFLPQEVGTLLVYYLWLVLPFWEGIQANLRSQATFSPFLWPIVKTEDDPSNPDTLEPEEDYTALQTLARELGFSGTQIPQRAPPIASSQPTLRDLGISTKIWTSARLSRTLKRWGQLGGVNQLTISTWRHMAVAIGRRYIQDLNPATPGVFQGVDFKDSGSEDEIEAFQPQNSTMNLQTGHTSWTSGLVYGRQATEGLFETYTQRQKFRSLSQEWHRLLGFTSALDPRFETQNQGLKRKGETLEVEHFHQLQLSRWRQLCRIDLKLELQRLLGPEANFRTLQQPILQAIIQNQSPILVILPTSAGKSLLFMLPAASHPGGVTVVIVPLTSLQGNLQERCQKLGIPTAQWKTNLRPITASLILVTPEAAMTKRFQAYLDSLQALARLDRIIIDKCHTILEGNLKFRPKLRELGGLSLRGIQTIYLTATLPIDNEKPFLSAVNTSIKDITIFQASTTRSNISY